MERRAFIKHTAAVASVSAVPGLTNAMSNVVPTASVQCHNTLVLVDERFSDSRRFAAAFAARGATVLSLDEDIGRLWYRDLRRECAAAHTRIAGLTLHTDLFISQVFARDLHRTLLEFGVHDCRGRQSLTHTLPSNSQLDLRSSEAWAAEVANALLEGKGSGRLLDGVTQASTITRAVDHPGTLYSWLII